MTVMATAPPAAPAMTVAVGHEDPIPVAETTEIRPAAVPLELLDELVTDGFVDGDGKTADIFILLEELLMLLLL